MRKADIILSLVLVSRQPYFMRSRKLDTNADNSLRVLHMLSREGQLTAGQIAQGLSITPASVTQILKKLEAAGTAQRVKSEEDCRVTLVTLTESGQELVEKRKQTVDKVQDELFAGFSQSDLTIFQDYLQRLVDNVMDEEFRADVNEVLGADTQWGEFDRLYEKFVALQSSMDTLAEEERTNDSFAKAHDQWVKHWRGSEKLLDDTAHA